MEKSTSLLALKTPSIWTNQRDCSSRPSKTWAGKQTLHIWRAARTSTYIREDSRKRLQMKCMGWPGPKEPQRRRDSLRLQKLRLIKHLVLGFTARSYFFV